jgi:transglutaminase-like putative cysteine protease
MATRVHGSSGLVDGHLRILLGHAVSRRDLLKAAGLAGLGLVGLGSIAGASSLPLGQPVAPRATAARRDPITDLAGALDYDAERIFRFVADEVRYEPYAGILRGAHGTLASRAGNATDQSLLLAALLDTSLLPYRFAIGELDTTAADALMDSAAADEVTVRRQTREALAGVIPGLERPPFEPTPEQVAILERARAAQPTVAAWASQRLDRTVDLIGAALTDAGIRPLDGFTLMPDSERARHVWVQVAATADWLDLDPSMPGALPGSTLARAVEIVDDLPDDMAHVIELSVIGETLTPNGLVEQRLVGISDRADRLAGLPIMVANTAPEALTALGVSVAGALGGGSAYVPVIVVGDDAVVGSRPISFPRAASDGAGSTPGPDPAATPGFLAPGGETSPSSAEWVELVIRSPEAEPVIVRREIFDRLGPARRSAATVSPADLAPLEHVDLPDGSTDQVLAALTSHWLSVSTGLPSRDDAVSAPPSDDDPADLAIVSQAYGLARTAAATEVGTPAGIRPFVDSPTVTAYALVAQPSPDGRHGIASVLDIWHRSHGVLPVAGASSTVAPTLASGVLAQVAESVLAGEASEGGVFEADARHASVGALLEATDAAGVAWRALVDPVTVAELPWDADARARLARSMAAGWIAIVPERAVRLGDRERVGWWLIDPTSGRARDEMDDGRGAAATDEVSVVTKISMRNLAAKRRFGLCLAGVTVAVASGILLYFAQADLASGDTVGGIGLGLAAGQGFVVAVALMLQGDLQGAGAC